MSTEHEATEPTADATPDAPLDRGVVIGEGLTTLARWSWRLLLVAGARRLDAESARDDRQERPVHGLAHDVRQVHTR